MKRDFLGGQKPYVHGDEVINTEDVSYFEVCLNISDVMNE